MFEIFRNYLKSYAPITDEEFELIEAVCAIKKIRKRQYLLQEGDVWKYNGFICKGFVRTYSVDEKGQEHIMNFAPENHWTGDRESLLSGKPSKFNIEALEDSEIALINKTDFDLLCKKITAFNDLVNQILEKRFVVFHSRIHDAISLSAEENYQNFMQKNPAIANRVPQHMIASYLGISPETLSRIRKQAAKK